MANNHHLLILACKERMVNVVSGINLFIMPHSPEKVFKSWLALSGLNVSGDLLNQLVKGHPDYPSLISITETLDYLGIECMAGEISKDMLHEVQAPFLTCYGAENDTFVIITDHSNIEEKYPGFFEGWNGVVVQLHKKPDWKNEENSSMLKPEVKRKYKMLGGLALLAGITGLAMAYTTAWQSVALIALASAGVLVSWLIVSGELGISNMLTEKVCGNQADCNAVSQSKAGTLFWGIKWSDVGIIWFSSLLAVIVLAAFSGYDRAVVNLVAFITPGIIPFLLFSVYYQWRVVRKWCRLCLITAALLSVHLLLLLPVFFEQPWQKTGTGVILLSGTALSVTGLLWFSVRQLLEERRSRLEEIFRGMRFRRNEMIFNALLESRPATELFLWENELFMGNAAAPLQIMVACNPYCQPCAGLHTLLHDFISRKSEQAGITVRFAVDTKDKEDKRTKAAVYLIAVIGERIHNMTNRESSACTAEILHYWFSLMNLEEFSKKYPVSSVAGAEMLLNRHARWAAINKISYTPAVFINGKEVPVIYDRKDMMWQLFVLAAIEPETTDMQETETELMEEIV